MSRTKNSVKNVAYAIGFQAISTLISFITRTALVKTVGLEAISLNGLFTEVISMLSLTEMGVGTAIIYNLYKPLADHDYDKVGQLMNLFKKAYYAIAAATLVIGMALAPWIQYIVNDIGYDTWYIQFIYALFVLQTASSYLFSYKASLLNADQKKYAVNIITAIVKGIGTIAFVIVLIVTHNYVAYLITNIILNVAINVTISLYVDKEYPYIKESNMLPAGERKQVFANIKNIFIRTLSGKITNSTDNILISTLVSTLQVGLYSNYSLFITVMKQLSVQLIGGITGSLGNLMVTETGEHCSRTLKRMTFIFYVIGSVMTLGYLACLSPVIQIWIGDSYVMAQSIVFVCCIVMFLEFVSRPLWEIMTVSGLFEKDRNISIAGSVINLIVSIILGIKIGICGIFIGTICTYFVQIIFKLRLLYIERLKVKMTSYAMLWIKMCSAMFIMMVVISVIKNLTSISNPWIAFFVYGLVAVIMSIVTNFLVFYKTDEFTYCISIFRKIILKRKLTGEEKIK